MCEISLETIEYCELNSFILIVLIKFLVPIEFVASNVIEFLEFFNIVINL